MLRKFAQRAGLLALVGASLSMGLVFTSGPAQAAGAAGPDWVPDFLGKPGSYMDYGYDFMEASLREMTKPGTPNYARAFANTYQWNPARAEGYFQQVTGFDLDGARDAQLDRLGREKYGDAGWERRKEEIRRQYRRPGGGAPGTATSMQLRGGQVVAAPKVIDGQVISSGPAKDQGAFMKNGQKFARGAGTALAAVSGFDLGLSLGGGIAELVGLPTSGSTWCDFKTLVADSDCAFGPDQTYIVNSDINLLINGWTHIPSVFIDYERTDSGGRWFGQVAVTDEVFSFEPEFPSKRNYYVPLEFSGEAGSRYGPSIFVGTYCQKHDGSVSLESYGSVHFTGPDVEGGPEFGATWIRACSGEQYSGLDHFDLRGVGNAQLDPVPEWYPPGHVSRPPDIEGNPVRYWRTDWDCSDAASSSALSDGFRENDEAWPPPPVADCGLAEVVAFRVYQETEGSPDELVYEWEMPQQDQDFLEEYPECARGECLLELFKVTDEGKRVACFFSPQECTNWLEEVQNDEADYQCTYGGNDVAITECYIYGPTFNRDKVLNEAPYGDPTTGQTPDLGSDTSTPPGPSPGDGTAGEADECPPAFGWAVLTPRWHYNNMVCALKAAFVPTNPNAKIDRIITSINSVPPVAPIREFATVFDFEPGEAGCRGPGLRWGLLERTIYPFDACDEPLAGVASKTKMFATVALAIGGSWACVRAVGSGFNWRPGVSEGTV